MTDLDGFLHFFQQYGVPYTLWPESPGFHGGANLPPEATQGLSVSQAEFWFDADGRFVGVLSDETQAWESRQ